MFLEAVVLRNQKEQQLMQVFCKYIFIIGGFQRVV